MSINELEQKIASLKEELHHCKSYKGYCDKKKYYDRLCKERNEYYRLRKETTL